MAIAKNKPKRRALGKGLDALIPGASTMERQSDSTQREYLKCPIHRVKPDPDQPRRNFDKEALDELVISIREQGIIQPLIVRRVGEHYELIAGERRWRAAQLAGLKEVPLVVKDVSELQAFEMALVENIQREDLNPIEEAEAINRLLQEHNYTQAQLSERIGRNRSTISNSLRLLGLPLEVKQMVLNRDLTEGHARAILQAGKESAMIALAKLTVAKQLSVRATEGQARSIANGKELAQKAAKPVKEKSPQVRNLIERMQKALGAKVDIHDNGGKGKLEIVYTSYEELDSILDRILR
ncbi:MAG: ParB/RepB/Spo0J family partition protein [Deltaproteobacteria bacterium]|nr:ParB/RepB/Spo0J family partition protein [Deltaproteobacteria bacterium]MBN2672391.1 ParB/RepB/Spo0J family partition protein [Deltaproteobacteria bacterium]